MKIDKKLRDKLVGLAASMQDEEGLELCDPQSKYVEIGPRRLSLAEQIKRVLRQEVERYAEHAAVESPEDAEDFDIADEDPLPVSGFEHEDMVEEVFERPLEDAVAAAELEESEVLPAVEGGESEVDTKVEPDPAE